MSKTSIEWTEAVWNPVPSASGYYASEDGRILSTVTGNKRILSPMSSADGHKYVFVSRKKRWVHHLVLEAFGRDRRAGLECRHLDGNPCNNHIDNLAWGTRQENADDRKRHGTVPTGERSGTHKLTKQDVIQIRSLHGKETLRSLASRFGVSHTAIRRAALGIKWASMKEGLIREQ